MMSTDSTAALQEPRPTTPAAGLHVPLRAALFLLYYFFTNLPVLKFFWYTGLCLLPVSLLGYFYSPVFAWGVGLYVWVAMLVLPYMAAAAQQRLLLGNHRLNLTPGFPLATGLVLLIMTVSLAGFIPVLVWLYNVPERNSLLGLQIFVAASLYSAVLHYCMVSRHAVLLFCTLPISIAVVLFQWNVYVQQLWNHSLVMLLASLVCVTGWAVALQRLHASRVFKPPFHHAGAFMTGNGYSSQVIFPGWQLQLQHAPPGPSLLLGFPATLPSRLLRQGYTVLVAPLVCTCLLLLVWNNDGETRETPSLLRLLFLFHLYMVFILSASAGELAARSRLLWLRMADSRAQLWQYIEAQLWTQYALLSCYTLVLLLALLLLDLSDQALPWPMVLNLLLLTACATLHNGYLNLLVRLQHWRQWTQALALAAFTGVVLIVVGFGFKNSAYNLMTACSACLLLLTWWFRQLCRHAFTTVDWLKLKPLNFKRHGAGQA